MATTFKNLSILKSLGDFWWFCRQYESQSDTLSKNLGYSDFTDIKFPSDLWVLLLLFSYLLHPTFFYPAVVWREKQGKEQTLCFLISMRLFYDEKDWYSGMVTEQSCLSFEIRMDPWGTHKYMLTLARDNQRFCTHQSP